MVFGIDSRNEEDAVLFDLDVLGGTGGTSGNCGNHGPCVVSREAPDRNDDYDNAT